MQRGSCTIYCNNKRKYPDLHKNVKYEDKGTCGETNRWTVIHTDRNTDISSVEQYKRIHSNFKEELRPTGLMFSIELISTKNMTSQRYSSNSQLYKINNIYDTIRSIT